MFKLNQNGAALVQIMFASAMVGALAYSLISQNQGLLFLSHKVSQGSQLENYTKQIAAHFRSRQACMNSINTAGRIVYPEGSDRPGRFNQNLPGVFNSAGNLVYRICPNPLAPANPEAANPFLDCAVTMTTGETLYLTQVSIENITPLDNYNSVDIITGELFFRYTSRELTEAERAGRPDTSGAATIRQPISLLVGAGGTIDQCLYMDNSPYDDFCNSLSGTFDAKDDFLCKSLSIGYPNSRGSDYALYVNGNFQSLRHLRIQQSLDVGYPVGTPPTASPNGTLNITGNARANNSIVVGSFPTPAQVPPTGVMHIKGGLSLQPSQFVAPANSIVTTGEINTASTIQLTLANNASLEATPTRAVTTGWVRHKLANVLAVNGAPDLNSIFTNLATAAYGDHSNAEQVILRDFCTRSSMKTVVSSNTYGANLFGVVSSPRCRFNIQHMAAASHCNVKNGCESASNNTFTYHANRICLNGECRSTTPAVVNTGSCIAPTTASYPNHTVTWCGGNRILVGGNCCLFRVMPN